MGVSRRPLARQKGGAAMNLNELKDRAYKTAKAHGWHDKELSDETYLMLIITEIAEAVQADRKGKHADVAKFKEWQEKDFSLLEETSIRRFKEDFEEYVKNTVEDEFADVVIRCLSFAGHRGWDLQHALDDVLSTSEADEIYGDETFAEMAYYACSGIIMAIDQEKAVHSVLANVVSYCNYKGIDIDWHVEQKMRYNELRPYKHGGKAY